MNPHYQCVSHNNKLLLGCTSIFLNLTKLIIGNVPYAFYSKVTDHSKFSNNVIFSEIPLGIMHYFFIVSYFAKQATQTYTDEFVFLCNINTCFVAIEYSP